MNQSITSPTKRKPSKEDAVREKMNIQQYIMGVFQGFFRPHHYYGADNTVYQRETRLDYTGPSLPFPSRLPRPL